MSFIIILVDRTNHLRLVFAGTFLGARCKSVLTELEEAQSADQSYAQQPCVPTAATQLSQEYLRAKLAILKNALIAVGGA